MLLAGNAMLQRLAFQQLHGDERTALEFANVVNGADVRMVERGSGARFATESLDSLSVMRNIVGQEFQRDIATETRVLGLINHTHSAAADLFEHVVMRDGATNHRSGIRHRTGSLSQPHIAGKRADGREAALDKVGASHWRELLSPANAMREAVCSVASNSQLE